MSTSNRKRVLIRDYGGYCFMAERFARAGYEVIYYVPNDEQPWGTPDKDEIGSGIPGVKRLTGEDDFYELVDAKPREIDFFAFFDVGEGGLQQHLRRLGYPVYGSGEAQILELDKFLFNNKALDKAGLPYVPFVKVKGTEALKGYLRGKKDLYIKISFFRGCFETIHYTDWDDFEESFLDIEVRLGKRRKTQVFLIQTPIKAAIEIGNEAFRLNGDCAGNILVGLEDKDCGYIGRMFTKGLPPMFRHVEDKMRPFFEKYGYQGSYATEYRVTNDNYSKDFRGKPYFTDLTAREPSPPGEARSEAYSNFPQCVEAIAYGKMPNPKYVAPYVAEITLLSAFYGDGDDGHWTRVEFPPEIAKFVRLKNYCMKDGHYWLIPNQYGEFMGSAVGLGNSFDEATSKALTHASMVKAKEIHYDKSVFERLRKECSKARQFGIAI